MNKLSQSLSAIGSAAGLLILFSILYTLPVMWLWNLALIPAVDGIHPIGFWQAMGISALSGFLFRNRTSKKD